MNLDKQVLLINNILSSKDVASRCLSIILPEYFNQELRVPVKFLLDYFKKYNALPSVRTMNAETDQVKFSKVPPVTMAEFDFTCNEIELFCQQEALFKAVSDSAPDIAAGDRSKFGKVLERVQKALTISLQRDLGVEMYSDPEPFLISLLQSQTYEPTGIKGIDGPLGGGLARKQFTLFSANSGGGKSVMLSNLGANYVRQGYHVIYISLELSQEMIFLRNASIMTAVNTDVWRESIPEITSTLIQQKKEGAGTYVVKRMPNGSTSNDIRSYLKFYEIEYNRRPDVIIVDYLDLMTPNGGSRDMGIFEQDKLKAEQLAEIGHAYNAVVISASQQNRDGIKTATPDQSIIAGGISKINTVDNYISIYMDPSMRIKGEMIVYFLKTRSSSAVGSSQLLSFNPKNLIISDSKQSGVSALKAIANKRRADAAEGDEPLSFPGIASSVSDEDEHDDFDYNSDDLQEEQDTVIHVPEPITQKSLRKIVREDDDNDLMNLMSSVQGYL